MSPAGAGLTACSGMGDINVARRYRGPAEEQQEEMMRTLGYITTVTLVAAAAALGLVAVKSLPDVRRILTVRKM